MSFVTQDIILYLLVKTSVKIYLSNVSRIETCFIKCLNKTRVERYDSLRNYWPMFNCRSSVRMFSLIYFFMYWGIQGVLCKRQEVHKI